LHGWYHEVYLSETGILRQTCSATEAGLVMEVVCGFLEQQPDSLADHLETVNQQQNLLNEVIVIAAAMTTSLCLSIFT